MERPWDAIVVGAGSAGGVLGLRLAERGRRVLVLEAGPDFPGAIPPLLTTDLRVPVSEYDWGYRSEGDREIDLPRGRVVGGSSATNAAAWIRPQPADLDGWGLPEWSWEACLPALCRIESDRAFGDAPHHGSDGPINVERLDLENAAPVTRAVYDALRSAGHDDEPDQNAPGATGAGPQPANVRDGARESTLTTYLRRARELPDFELRAEVLVDRVLVEGGRARGVVTAGGDVLRAEQVLIAAGVFASPLVLMRSGIGPAAQLAEHGIDCIADLPVGEGMHDHPALGIMAMAHGPDLVDRNLVARVMARASFAGARGAEDVHLFGPFTAEGTRSPMPPDGFVVAGMVAKPTSRGWVRLRSADTHDAPRVCLNFLETPEDLDAMTRLLLAIEDVLTQPALSKLIASLPWRPSQESLPELRRVARAGALTDHHEAGTCPIGAVVDEHLRVYGVDGLRVCDASVLPGTPRCNTNAPTMMVAERLIELMDAEA
ncbi:MAG TPA: GMC oxidoreductase [Actinomycetota bacterium]